MKHLLDLGVWALESELLRCDEKKNLSLQVDAEGAEGLEVQTQYSGGAAVCMPVCVCVCVCVRG